VRAETQERLAGCLVEIDTPLRIGRRVYVRIEQRSRPLAKNHEVADGGDLLNCGPGLSEVRWARTRSIDAHW
jgi:hypothetical protein